MMFRTTIRTAALVLGLLLSVGLGAPLALACEGAECQTDAKPLDLKRFMREQAASTRTPEAMGQTRSETRHTSTRKTAQVHHPRHRTVAMRHQKQPQKAPVAAKANAEQVSAPNSLDVQVVSADEVNDIDRAAGPAPAETDGQGSPSGQDAQTSGQGVHVVVQNDFNEIDRRAADLVRLAPPVAATMSEAVPQSGSVAMSWTMSWVQWLWSAIGAGFVVLAGVARYLLA